MNKKKPQDFIIGQVYKMDVGRKSHVRRPYYVIIKDVGPDFIETNIPGKHSLKIQYNAVKDGGFASNWNKEETQWQYQVSRMTFIGIGKAAEKLLYGQTNLMSE